jgi:hypothetical protein
MNTFLFYSITHSFNLSAFITNKKDGSAYSIGGIIRILIELRRERKT